MVRRGREMTNGDRIRNMSNEELTKFIQEVSGLKFVDNFCDDYECEKESCGECFLKWLNSEAED
ncbi:hypothetical protein [Bacteroides acidifaciens]|uniref:hypothetical protein n=1 Tax=Bacteroides acidifaciens TaxID=85831 RepID=UPI00248AA5B8|nr:hypothetical protein [Bacteroides acidifaciens]